MFSVLSDGISGCVILLLLFCVVVAVVDDDDDDDDVDDVVVVAVDNLHFFGIVSNTLYFHQCIPIMKAHS